VLRRVSTRDGTLIVAGPITGVVAADPELACAVSDIGGRLEMEDAHVLEVESVAPLRVLGAVFDGHGGAAVAKLAARRFQALFRESLGGGPEAALRAALASIHREAQGMPGGAAAATFYVDGPRVAVANAGDAHVVAVSGDAAVRLTEEHRITNEAELQRVVAAGATIWGPYVCLPSGDGLMVTRSLADFEFERIGIVPEPVVSTHPLPPGFLVAACDGLWDVVAAEELPGLLRDADSAKEAANRLAHDALRVRHTGDNVTIIVIRTG